jgi:putative redox protein
MTKKVTLRWTKDREFIAYDNDEGGSVGITVPNPPNSQSMGASHLLLAALGGCMGTTIIAVMHKKRLNIEFFEIEVTGEHIDKWPMTFTHYHLVYRIKGEGVDDKIMETAIYLAHERYCTVSSSTSGTKSYEYEILPVDAPVPA